MTACVNNEKKTEGGALSHKVLRSAVAGVLAVSMVPTAAMAAETSAVESGEASALSVQSATQAFKNGVVTKVVDENGKEIAIEDGVVELVANGERQYVYPAEITLPDGQVIDLLEKDDQGNALFEAQNNYLTKVGSRGVGVKATQYAQDKYGITVNTVNQSVDLNVVAASLSGAFAYEGQDMSDKTFVWNGSAQDVHFAIGDTDITDYVDVAYNYMGGTGTSVTDAGTYEVVLTGKSDTMYENSTVKFELTVEQLDLSDLTFVANDLPESNTDALSCTWMDGTANLSSAIDGSGEVKYQVYDADGEEVVVASGMSRGDYTVKATAKDGAKNVTGGKEDTFRVVGEVVSTFEYNNAAVNEGDKLDTYTLDDIKAKEGFDPSKISVEDSGNNPLSADDYTVTVTKDGKEVTSYGEIGSYVVTVEVKTNADNYDMAGKRTFSFDVVKGAMADVKSYVNFGGNVVSAINHTYDGSDVIDGTIVTVKDGDTVLKEGVDYELVWTDADDNEVSEVVNSGSYKLTIKGLTYSGSDTVNVTVEKIKPASVRITGLKTVYTKADNLSSAVTGLAYTGEEIIPSLEYSVEAASSASDETVEWKALPIENYELAYTLNGKAADLVEAGTYDVALSELTPEIDNFDLSDVDGSGVIKASQGAAGKLNVIDSTCFSDVKAADWHAETTTLAAALDYVNGVGDTGTFVPGANIDRAQIVSILFNMAGGEADPADSHIKYPSRFSDVEADAWYSKAVAWAVEAGVVNGYDETTFGTFDNATREQVAAMFYNYAKATGQDVTVEDEAAALAKYSDADKVSPWMTTAVAWAIENGVMGNNSDEFRAQDTITRAEVAAMAINFQPEGKLA